MATGCLTLTRSLTLTLPEQGEVGALRSEQNQQEYQAGGSIGAAGRWETPPPGAGQRARCQNARPTSVLLPAHTGGLKAPQPCAQRSAGLRVHLPPTGFPKKEANEGPTRKTLPHLGGPLFCWQHTGNVPETKEMTSSYYHNPNTSSRGEKNCSRKMAKDQGKYIAPIM